MTHAHALTATSFAQCPKVSSDGGTASWLDVAWGWNCTLDWAFYPFIGCHRCHFKTPLFRLRNLPFSLLTAETYMTKTRVVRFFVLFFCLPGEKKTTSNSQRWKKAVAARTEWLNCLLPRWNRPKISSKTCFAAQVREEINNRNTVRSRKRRIDPELSHLYFSDGRRGQQHLQSLPFLPCQCFHGSNIDSEQQRSLLLNETTWWIDTC